MYFPIRLLNLVLLLVFSNCAPVHSINKREVFEFVPWEARIANEVVPPYEEGVGNFSQMLDVLVAGANLSEVVNSEVVETSADAKWRLWGETVNANIHNLHSSLSESVQGSTAIVGDMNRELENLADRTSEVDDRIATKKRDINSAERELNGALRALQQAEVHLRDAEDAFSSQNRALRDLQTRLNKVKHGCISGRKKREASAVEIGAHFRQKRQFGNFNPFKRVLQNHVRKVASPHVVMSKALQSIICQAVGTLTGAINRAKTDRDTASRARDAAARTRDQRHVKVLQWNFKIEQIRYDLRNATQIKSNLQTKRADLATELATLGSLNEDLKATTRVLGSLTSRGAQLKDAIETMVILDVDIFFIPMSQIGDILKTKSSTVISLPQLSDDMVNAIRQNLADFENSIPDFPLIVQ